VFSLLAGRVCAAVFFVGAVGFAVAVAVAVAVVVDAVVVPTRIR
jgi:hypothetical protein